MSYPSPGETPTASIDGASAAGAAIDGAEGVVALDHWPDAVLVVDQDRREVLNANVAFLELAGAERVIDLAPPVDLVAPEDRSAFLALGQSPDEPEVPIHLANQDVEAPPHWVRARFVACAGGGFQWVYVFRDGGPVVTVDGDRHRRITGEAVQNSIQIYFVADRIRSAPKLAARLFGIEDRQRLFEEAADFLCSSGFSCRDMTVVEIQGNQLRPVFSTRGDLDPESFQIDEPRYRHFLETGEQPAEPRRLLQLPGRNGLIGVLELSFHQREFVLAERNPEVASWHADLLETIAEILALFLVNIDLHRELKALAIRDTTTGLYNRRFLFSQLQTEFVRAQRHGREVSVLFVDLDYFKEINDQYGHREGDLVLQQLGAILTNALRETDFVCRYGGDEFVIVLPETGAEAAREKALKLCQRVRAEGFSISRSDGGIDAPPPLTLSIGIASSVNAESTRELLSQADRALYRAKERGRDGVVVYEVS